MMKATRNYTRSIVPCSLSKAVRLLTALGDFEVLGFAALSYLVVVLLAVAWEVRHHDLAVTILFELAILLLLDVAVHILDEEIFAELLPACSRLIGDLGADTSEVSRSLCRIALE